MNTNLVEIIGDKKITFRARDLVGRSLWPNRIEMIEELAYSLFAHESSFHRDWKDVFTTILTAHGNKVDYFKKSFDSAIKQTSSNIELILVDHGCESELRQVIYESFLSDSRIKLIRFENNLYDGQVSSLLKDRVFNAINAALFCSEGEYVYFLSFDDFLSANYVESMRAIFLGHPKCVVASPSVVSVNEFSEVNSERTKHLREMNIRKTYMDGMELATSVIEGGTHFAAPGGLFAYQTKLVLANGGFDCMNDLSQVFKFAVLGNVGTNYDAVLFWRHHIMQTNKMNAKQGALHYRVLVEWLSHIKEFYLQHDIQIGYQKSFFRYMEERLKNDSILSIQTSIRTGFVGSFRIFGSILKEAPNVFLLHFMVCFLKNLQYVIYSSLPEGLRERYRAFRRCLVKLTTNFKKRGSGCKKVH